MKMRRSKGWLVLVLAGMMIAGCERHSIYNPDKAGNQTKEEYFDFSTSQEIKMDIQYDVPEGYRVVFDIYDQLPMVEENGRIVLNKELEPIASGITNGYGKYDLEKVFPAAVKEFYVYTSDLFATPLLRGKIENGNVTMESVDLADLRTQTSQMALTTRATETWETLGTWEKGGEPNYLNNEVQISSNTLNTIKKNFPNKVKANSIFFKKTDLYVAEDANVWLTVIGSYGDYKNTLGYYCYTGEPEDLRPEDVKKIVAFPNAKAFTKTSGVWNRVTKHQCIQLKYRNPETGRLEETFPKGTRIGWVLISDGFQKNNGTVNYKNEYFYSHAPWNPEKNNKDHMVLFKTKNYGEDFVAFGFEDMNNKNGDQDCNDVMFHVFANPTGSITEEIPEIPEQPEEDIVKDEIHHGTLAFEDLWPSQGDYDLNDVVVKYKSTVTTVVKGDEDYDSYGKVSKVKDEFSLVWSGADIHNAFGYQMNVDNSDIQSLKVFGGEQEIPSAWDKDFDKVTMMLTDDVLGEIGKSTGNVMDYTVEIEFTNSVFVKDFNKEKAHAPYNPFIVSRGGLGVNRVEVHLPMYEPTTKNNAELLGTADDRSEVSANRYYVSEEMFPFAIHILGNNDFINRKEAVRIDKTYPKYSNWVEKNGKEDADWYKFPAEN